MNGIVIVSPTNAMLTHDTDTFSSMDPYVTVRIGSAVQKTGVHNSGGKTPYWSNEMLEFNLAGDNEIFFQVWDKDMVSADDLIGEGRLDLYQLNPQQLTYTVYLEFNGAPAGSLNVNVQLAGNQGGFNQGGYNQGGYNQNQGGFNQGGYNQNQGGYNQGGYNQGGYDKDEYY